MRKLAFLFIAFVAASQLLRAEVADELTYDWGPADTVEQHKVGPGMDYTKIIFHDKPVIVWFVEVDMQNPYAKVEQVQSRHAVPDVLRWDVMTHYRENTYDGHRVKVAWNHDFFSYDDGICIGINISEGEMTWNKWGRSVLAITDDGHGEVFAGDFDARAIAPDGTEVVIDYYNAYATGLSGDCILYNRFNSKTLVETGRYIALKPLDSWIVNGEPIRCEVIEISDSPIQTAPERYVLYLRNGKLNALNGHVSVGQQIAVRQNFAKPWWGTSPSRILNAFHGYPSIVHDGVLQDGEYNNFENGREYEKSSRVMAGVSADKTKLYIATTEMSANSTGVDCIELAAFMVEKGAYDVVNFDSGGSAAIVIDEQMLNLPGRGAIRPVVDAALAVSVAPDDPTPERLSFSRQAINVSTISRTPLRVMALNKYDEIVEDNLTGCTFKCQPEELGYVDRDAIFHASATPMCGKILVEKDGTTGELFVTTKGIENIRPRYDNILIDNHRHLIVDVAGVMNGLDCEVDPEAFEWTFSPEGVARFDDNGLLYGVANGRTTLTGKYDNINFSINVTVETSDGERVIEPMTDLARLEYTKTSSIKNDKISYTDLPEGWVTGADIQFDLGTGRNSSITLNPKATIYGLPDSLSIRMYDKTGASQRIVLQFSDSHGARFTLEADTHQGDDTYYFPLVEADSTVFAYHRYPLSLTKMIVYFANKTAAGSEIALGPLTGMYPKVKDAGIEAVLTDGDTLSLQISGEQLVGECSETTGCVHLNITDMQGRTTHASAAIENRQFRANIKHLTPGIYVVQATLPAGTTHTRKLILR